MRFLLSLAAATLVYFQALGQSCGCNVTITREGSYDGRHLGYRPGQTICIRAGNYKHFYFKNVVGTATAPIKIINCGGPVTVSSDSGPYGIQFYDSKYVHLSGKGHTQYQHGIRVTKTPATTSGVVVTGFSSDFDIEGLEVSGTGFAGIMVKQDPTCEPATWRENFAMYNIILRGNFVHDTGGEGIYVGNSYWNAGMIRTCDGVSRTVYPHNIYGLKIYRNVTLRTGAEGIQYASAPNAQVGFNTVQYAGISPFDTFQNNGIQASGGVSGRLYNNVIEHAAGGGIVLIGHSGANFVYNNLITDAGESGIFCDNREGTPANSPVILANNTLVNLGGDGFRLYNELDLTTVANNIVIQPGTGLLIRRSPAARVSAHNNYYTSLLRNALSGRVISADFKPLPGSVVIDKGLDVAPWGILIDLASKPRLQGKKTDIGAYELTPASARQEAEANPVGEEVSTLEVVKEIAGENVGKVKVISFPSPCVDELTIRLGDGSALSALSLYTLQGIPLESTFSSDGADEIRLRTSSLPSGMYLFRVVTSDLRSFPGRFVKQ